MQSLGGWLRGRVYEQNERGEEVATVNGRDYLLTGRLACGCQHGSRAVVEPFKVNPPQRAKARAMGEVTMYADTLSSDRQLGKKVREIVERLRQEEAAYRASLNEHGAPLKVL